MSSSYKRLKTEEDDEDQAYSSPSSISSSSSSDDADGDNEVTEDDYDDDELVADIPISKLGMDEIPNAKFLNDVKVIAKSLHDKHLILIPIKELAKIVDISQCATIGDTKDSKLLYAVVTIDNENKVKILKVAGATTNGEKRANYLDKQQQFSSNERLYYLVTFNLDHLSEEANDEVVQSILKICKNYNTLDETKLQSMTFADALELQEEGLPFPLHALLYYIDKREACKVRGLLKRIALHWIESSVDELLSNELDGLNFDGGVNNAFRHEFLRGNYLLKKAEEKMKRVVVGLNDLLEKLEDEYGKQYVEHLQKMEIIVQLLAAWAPDVDCLIFTAVIYNVLVGEDNWWDAYLNLNPAKRGEGKDIYNAKNFKEVDHEVAKNTVREFHEKCKQDGSFRALNSNAEVFEKMNTTAKDFLALNHWEIVYEYGDVIFYG